MGMLVSQAAPYLLCYTLALHDVGARCNSAYLVDSHEHSGPL